MLSRLAGLASTRLAGFPKRRAWLACTAALASAPRLVVALAPGRTKGVDGGARRGGRGPSAHTPCSRPKNTTACFSWQQSGLISPLCKISTESHGGSPVSHQEVPKYRTTHTHSLTHTQSTPTLRPTISTYPYRLFHPFRRLLPPSHDHQNAVSGVSTPSPEQGTIWRHPPPPSVWAPPSPPSQPICSPVVVAVMSGRPTAPSVHDLLRGKQSRLCRALLAGSR